MSFTRKTRLVALAVSLFVTGLAMAQVSTTQTADATVQSSNTLSLTDSTALSFSVSPALAATDTSEINYSTNDGSTYRVFVSAPTTTAWSTAPVGASVYPVLSVSSVTKSSGGGTAQAGGEVISSANAGASVDLVTGITSTSGIATVEFTVSVTPQVKPGAYSATLTYTLATP